MNRIFMLLVAGIFVTQASAFAAQDKMSQQQKFKDNIISSDKLLGEQVFNKQGEEVGEVERIYLNRSDGQVAHVVVAIGGFLGVNERYYLIPWKKISADQGQLNIDMSKNDLMSAPYLEDDNFEENYEWIKNSYEFYGFEPEWEKSRGLI